ncbi:MAG TPA: GDSL-type esterase/lipase family protein [Gammaproteobacteria bacterium]
MNRDIRLCFIGDSFVNGTGDEMALGWAGRLAAAANAHDTPVTYYNLGIRRNTSRDILQRWAYECAQRLPDSCDGRVVLSCGVNDTVIEAGALRVAIAESCQNVQEILQRAGKYKLLMVGPPPVDDDEQNQRILALSQAYAGLAQGLGVPFIELYSQLVADPHYRSEVASNDGAHPRSRGYTRMAEIIGASPHWWFPHP